MSEFIRVQDREGIRTIAFARPEKKNAITREMYARIVSAMKEAQDRDDLKVVLFTGMGDCFTAGNDVADFLHAPPADADAPVFQLLHLLVDFPKPLVAAVSGIAIGIGTTLLLHCDLVYASETATFKMPFVDLGLVPEAASSALVPALVGQRKAAEWLLLSDAIDANSAVQAGLINKVLPAAEVMSFARTKALALAAKPTQALIASKALMKRSSSEDLHARINIEAAEFTKRLNSDESKAIFAAFLSKKSA